MDKKNPFHIIKGAQDDGEPILSRQQKIDKLNQDMNRRGELTARELADIPERIKKQKILDLKADILKEAGVILTDEEAKFINGHLFGMANRNPEALDELYKKFPKLIDYFNKILSGFLELPEDK